MQLSARKLRPSTRRNLAGLAFISPGLIGLVFFCMLPMFYSLGVGFTKWNMKTPPVFIGLDNFKAIFKDPVAMGSIRVTLTYTLLSVPLCNIYALMMAMLLNTKVKAMSYFRTIFYIPSVVPAVAASAIWMFIFNPFNGFLNSVFLNIGLTPQMWIYSPKQVIPCLAVMAAWSSGSTAIIYLAALQGVPRPLYEAIDVDGGNAWHKFANVTLPTISPVIFYNIVMTTIGSLQTFTQAYIMTNGGPNNASLFYVLLLYRRAFTQSDMGMACAMAWLLFVLIAIITALNFLGSKKWVFYGG